MLRMLEERTEERREVSLKMGEERGWEKAEGNVRGVSGELIHSQSEYSQARAVEARATLPPSAISSHPEWVAALRRQRQGGPEGGEEGVAAGAAERAVEAVAGMEPKLDQQQGVPAAYPAWAEGGAGGRDGGGRWEARPRQRQLLMMIELPGRCPRGR